MDRMISSLPYDKMQEKDLEVVVESLFRDYGGRGHTIDLYNVLGDLKYMLEKKKPGLLINYNAIVNRKIKEKFSPSTLNK